jgi:transcription elongation GreA/GreB family factor
MTFKQAALDACMRYVEARIETARQSMENAQNAANQEGKSSAGDKYETGRAMMQIERDNAAQQLAEAMRLGNILDELSAVRSAKTVSMGSLVITGSKKIFISIGIGKLLVDNVELLVVGPHSPLAKVLMSKSVGDTVTFNNESLKIEAVA